MGEGSGIKHCTECCKDKPLDEFSKDASVSDGKRAKCSRCTANAAAARYHQNGGREKRRGRMQLRRAEKYAALEPLKDVPCGDCGIRFPRVCMDFDHVSGEKILSISKMVHKDFSMEAILAEVAKCEVVCSNCHRIRTANRGQWYGAEEERAV